MRSKGFILLPADFSYISAEESFAIQGGAEIETFDSIASDITKISKVLNYMARIFAASSLMLNSLVTIYNTVFI